MFTDPAAAQKMANCQASKDLPNLGCVNSDFYRGAQPTAEGIKELAGRGVKTIINLRRNDDITHLEELQAQKVGIKFINISFGNWFAPKDEKITEVLNIINSPENQPVFVHCKRGADRTGTVVAAYRISQDGWTAKQAQAEAENFKFGWWQIWMKRYTSDFHKKSLNNKSLQKTESQFFNGMLDDSAAVALN